MQNPYTQPAAEFSEGTYFSQQHADPANPAQWSPCTRETLLARLAGDRPPEFRTILAAVQVPADLGSFEGWTYAGPLGIDIDGDDLADSIAALHKALANLQGLGLDLRQVRLYLSGSKGAHIEVPQACIMPTIPPEGTADLPKIYREMVLQFYVNGIDLRVFSGRRGRQWRVPNQPRRSPRPTGTFKVPVTLHEVAGLTPEGYRALCSSPRPHPELAPPTLCPGLYDVFLRACKALVKRTGKARAKSEALKGKLQQGVPDVLRALMAGAIPNTTGAGWNSICIQMASIGHACGWSEDELLSRCAGLIEHHRGDSRRYATQGARGRELRSVFRASTYPLSEAALKAILPPELRPALDLGGR